MKLKFTLRIKPEHNPPDLGSGKGVICTQEVIDSKIDGKDFLENPEGYPMEILGINAHAEELMKQWVECNFEVIE